MEAVGLAIGLITLVESVQKAANAARRLCKTWEEAPAELSHLSALLADVEAELRSTQTTAGVAPIALRNISLRQNLDNLFRDAELSVQQLEKLYLRLQEHGKMRQLAHWAIKDRQISEQIIHKLRSVRTDLMLWLQLLDLSLAIARVLQRNHPILAACKDGNLLAVRKFLENGTGRSTDVTDENWTPMTYAIQSGSADVVDELLTFGADIEGTFGRLQTTPLQWAVWYKQLDITRLLLRRGASQDRVNLLGWNVTFFCWPQLVFDASDSPDMLDCLAVLSENDYQALNTTDTEGWTVLHRRAAYGTRAQVSALLRLGAQAEHVALPLRWNALHHAVHHGNTETYRLLLPYFGDEIKSMVEERGWTLPHIAALGGHDAIIRDLLSHGLDPEARSRPFRSHMADSLIGKACTSRDVAAAEEDGSELQYVQALRDHGLASDTDVTALVADSPGDEVFFEAQEVL